MHSITYFKKVDKVKCYATISARWSGIDVNDFCWNNFTASVELQTGHFTSGDLLPHKIFPVITLCEALSMVLPLLIWSWCFGKNLKNQITAVIDQSNTLTDYYRMYDKGIRRQTVNETTLHRELDNFLELILSILMVKMPKIYVLYTLKWVVVIIFCHAWIIGQVFLLYPNLVIFEDTFLCVKMINPGTYASAQCSIPTSTFLRAVWYINIAFLSLVLICTFFCLIMIGKRVKYSSTFFYIHVPGAMDSRLADCIQESFNTTYYSLLSRFCEDNTHLCSDSGLARSLSRKYGVPDGTTPGKETIMDKHFPVLQPEQLKKFRLTCEQYKTRKQDRGKGRNKSKVRFAHRKDESDTVSMISATDSVMSRMSIRSRTDRPARRNKVRHYDPDVYLTPRLMTRKMVQDLKTIKNSSRLSSLNSSQRTPRSVSSVDIGKWTPRSSTPTPRKQDVQGRRPVVKYMDVNPQTTGHYPVFASRNREYNPYAYRLHTMIMQANAKNSTAWK
ncbi:unnamed protein product [Mytilus edulis]|uniref:Innexin n=1 Tax=Mytilus edulis TaxID=6550 RepID=A0A8S3V638_MYTED|nr:unnamed protein product [Mytilus edulis]